MSNGEVMVKKSTPVHPEVRSLLTEILAHCEKRECSRTSFGLDAVNDGNFVRSLERGRMPMFSTIDRVKAYMRIAKKEK